MAFIQRRLNVDATSWRCIDVEATLYRRHVSAGLYLVFAFRFSSWSCSAVLTGSLKVLTRYDQIDGYIDLSPRYVHKYNVPFCRTCFSRATYACKFPSVRPFVRPSVNIYPGYLMSATPLTVLYWSFWNFVFVFCMVWGCACDLDIIVRTLFCHFNPHCELSHLSPSIYRQWIPLGIANGQISSNFYGVICPRHAHIFVSGW